MSVLSPPQEERLRDLNGKVFDLYEEVRDHIIRLEEATAAAGRLNHTVQELYTALRSLT